MTTTTKGSTRHIVVDGRFAVFLAEDHPGIPLLGWVAKQPAPVHEEVSPCPRKNRKRCAEYSGIRRSLRPVEDIAAGLRRMSV